MKAKKRLRAFLETATPDGVQTKAVVSEAVPYIEINKQAHAFHVDLIIIGSRGKAADTEQIFFGTTAEKVLRCISYPVLCIPPATECK